MRIKIFSSDVFEVVEVMTNLPYPGSSALRLGAPNLPMTPRYA
jgi:hypothetical protein